MIKHLKFIQKLLEQNNKISCERFHKKVIKHPIKAENYQSTLLFKKTHNDLCAKNASKHYLSEIYDRCKNCFIDA